MTHLAAFNVGALMTLAMAVMSGPGSPAREPIPEAAGAPEVDEPEETPPRPVRRVHGVAPATLQELEDLESELALCRLEQRVMEGRLSVHEGEYQDWPDGLDDRYTPDALEDALARTVEGSGVAELSMMECEEYPCLAVLEATDPDQPCCIPLQRVLRDMEGYEDLRRSSISGVIDGRPVMVVALQPPEIESDTLEIRTSWRLNDVYEQLKAEAGEPQ
jgi:hypothetical protein